MLDMLRTVGHEMNEIYKTGSALVGQGYNRLLDTTVGKNFSRIKPKEHNKILNRIIISSVPFGENLFISL